MSFLVAIFLMKVVDIPWKYLYHRAASSQGTVLIHLRSDSLLSETGWINAHIISQGPKAQEGTFPAPTPTGAPGEHRESRVSSAGWVFSFLWVPDHRLGY